MTVDARQKIDPIYWNGLSQCGKITRKRELALFATIAYASLCKSLGISRAEHRNASKAAVDELVRSQMLYVVNQAQYFWRQGLDINDLIQDGNMGLLRGIQEFDPSRGNRLSTVVHHWIRNYMQRGEEVIGTFVKVSLSTRRNKASVDALDIAAQRLIFGKYGSLDETICGPDGNCLPMVETIPGKSPEPDDPSMKREARRELVAKAKHELKNITIVRGAEVVMRRLAGETLEHIGQSYGISKERVRQIEEDSWAQLTGRINRRLVRIKLKRRKRRRPKQSRKPMSELSVA
jgi:RNA polymerase sigma factor (sigma-70 family)